MARHRTTLPHATRTRRVRSMRSAAAIGAVLLALAAAACGGSSASPPKQPSTAGITGTSTDSNSALDLAVRRALRANYQLSSYVLWHNALPRDAQQSTRGPALAALRNAAAQRRKSGIRIRPVIGRLTIASVVVDPSFTRATATTVASGRVRPYENGRAEPKEIAVHERARVQLHRLGRSEQFVVWQVTVLR
jgi:hypothetical protein